MLRCRNNCVRRVRLGTALLFWLGGRCPAKEQLLPKGKMASTNEIEMHYEIHGQAVIGSAPP